MFKMIFGIAAIGDTIKPGGGEENGPAIIPFSTRDAVSSDTFCLFCRADG